MMPPGYFDSYHATDNEIVHLAGLTDALDDIIRESEAVDHTDRQGLQISALMAVIVEKAQALAELHHAEWEAIRRR